MSRTRALESLTALDVFPNLRRFGLRPRSPEWDKKREWVPIGHLHKPVDGGSFRGMQMSTIFSDLGVLAYAGCSAQQTSRIGDILRDVIGAGGPGLLRIVTGQSRETPLAALPPVKLNPEKDLLPVSMVEDEEGVIIEGQSSWTCLMTQAEKALVESLHLEDLSMSWLQNKEEADTGTATSLQQLGLYLQTSNGKRLLPVKRYLSWTISPGESGRLKTLRLRVHLVTVGGERDVGVANIALKDSLLPSPRSKAFSSTAPESKAADLTHQLQSISTWLAERHQRKGNEIEAKEPVFTPVVDSKTARSVVESCLAGLWQLEREIWASRATATCP